MNDSHVSVTPLADLARPIARALFHVSPALLAATLVTAGLTAGETTPDSPAAGGAAGDALRRGARWLITQQNEDGGFGPSVHPALEGASDVGISAFGLYALARVPETFRPNAGEAIQRGVRFLLSRQQDDGSFLDPRDPRLQNYKTSVGVLALLTVDRVAHREPIRKAVAFIKSQQVVDRADLGYGGIGYGSRDTNPDLSNLQFALEALHEAGESVASQTFLRVQAFLEKVQNLPGAEPIKIEAGDGDTPEVYRRSSGDGGFPYRIIDTRGPVETLDDGSRVFSSYGSMTYAGLKSLLYAQVGRDDPRVQAAFQWISRNFTVEENPGMATARDPLTGQQGLFYYYHTMAKALSAYGERVITDRRDRKHDWAKELSAKLVGLQRPEGFWVNGADRWMESLPVLCTSYALVALSVCEGGGPTTTGR